jgi:hypothetical protein
MAELIPVQYRIRAAQKTILSRWVFFGAVMLAAAGVGIFCAWNWQRQQAQVVEGLQNEYKSKSPIMIWAKEVKGNYDDLLKRLSNIDGLRDDSTLLSLVNHISAAAGEYDSFETMQIDARKGPGGEKGYFVRVIGVTKDSASIGELVERMGKDCYPKINVSVEVGKTEKYLDGEVYRFHILCEPEKTQG